MLYQTYLKIHIMYMLYNFKINETCSTQQKNYQLKYLLSIFRCIAYFQLLEYKSFTYTYLVADPDTREAILIDPVIETVPRDSKIVKDLGLNLKYASKSTTGNKSTKTVQSSKKLYIIYSSKFLNTLHLICMYHSNFQVLYCQQALALYIQLIQLSSKICSKFGIK